MQWGEGGWNPRHQGQGADVGQGVGQGVWQWHGAEVVAGCGAEQGVGQGRVWGRAGCGVRVVVCYS